MDHCVLKTTWHSFQTVILDKFLTGDNTLRKRSLLVQCAWCQRRLGWKRKQAAVPGATSHSICPRCAADIVRKDGEP